MDFTIIKLRKFEQLDFTNLNLHIRCSGGGTIGHTLVLLQRSMTVLVTNKTS